MSLTARILGCGSSGGVPRLGNHWGDCDPENPLNRRTRCSMLVQRTGPHGVTNVLIDTSPDLREQLLAADVGHMDGVLYTHAHADQSHGIDDLRALAMISRARVPVWADDVTREHLLLRFDYCFKTPPGSPYPPILDMNPLRAGEAVTVDGAGGPITAMPFEVEHGSIMALGFRINGLAYTPDLNDVPAGSVSHVEELDCWVIDALRRTVHPSHLSLAESLEWIERVKPGRAVLTNMHVDMDHARLCHDLPDHIRPAHDGMTIEIPHSG
ncbi:MAG: MBL fold metallo-hydrolase [Pseudomonadota bacterium]